VIAVIDEILALICRLPVIVLHVMIDRLFFLVALPVIPGSFVFYAIFF
jgi:hypothetical protein